MKQRRFIQPTRALPSPAAPRFENSHSLLKRQEFDSLV